jgi:hypothetical protein
MGINPNNKITIIIRMLFAVRLFQHIAQQHKGIAIYRDRTPEKSQ